MIDTLYHELDGLQERMRKKSKEKFRTYVIKKAEGLGLKASITPTTRWAKNVVVGDINQAKVVIGAHYDTPPRLFAVLANHLLLLNIGMVLVFLCLPFVLMQIFGIVGIYLAWLVVILMFVYLLGIFAIPNRYNANDNTSGVLAVLALMHEINNKEVAFVFFDNEEKGLFGSLALAIHLKKQRKKYIILDCIGRGNWFSFYYYRNKRLATDMQKVYQQMDNQDYMVDVKKGGYLMTSDHLSFQAQDHVGIICFSKIKNKQKMEGIHSHQDKTIDFKNILFLCEGIKRYIGERYAIN